MQWAVSTAGIWRNKIGQSVNPDKSGLVLYTRKKKLQGFLNNIFGVKLNLSWSVKYLGIILDSRLTWREHVEVKVRKAHSLLRAMRSGVGSETLGGSLALYRHRSANYLLRILSMMAWLSST
jgi:hypothetical protein